jgi:hypothetical protein
MARDVRFTPTFKFHTKKLVPFRFKLESLGVAAPA